MIATAFPEMRQRGFGEKEEGKMFVRKVRSSCFAVIFSSRACGCCSAALLTRISRRPNSFTTSRDCALAEGWNPRHRLPLGSARFCPPPRQVAASPVVVVLLEIEDRDVGALASERHGHRATDAGIAACDERRAAQETARCPAPCRSRTGAAPSRTRVRAAASDAVAAGRLRLRSHAPACPAAGSGNATTASGRPPPAGSGAASTPTARSGPVRPPGSSSPSARRRPATRRLIARGDSGAAPVMCCACREKRKPSNGLEPLTPSLPWRFLTGNGVHARGPSRPRKSANQRDRTGKRNPPRGRAWSGLCSLHVSLAHTAAQRGEVRPRAAHFGR